MRRYALWSADPRPSPTDPEPEGRTHGFMPGIGGGFLGADRRSSSAVTLALVAALGVLTAGLALATVGLISEIRSMPSLDRADLAARRRLLDAALLGCASVPIALAFRDSLWRLVGTSTGQADLADLDRLLAVVAAVVISATFLIEMVAHVHEPAVPR